MEIKTILYSTYKDRRDYYRECFGNQASFTVEIYRGRGH
jgi:hypothetical protein